MPHDSYRQDDIQHEPAIKTKGLKNVPYLTLNVPQMSTGLPRPKSPEPVQHKDVISMLDHRAQYSSQTVAVGFPSCISNTCIRWTYKDIQTISIRLAKFIQNQLINRKQEAILKHKPTFAIIAPSGPAFLAHVLGCWRLGCSILPIALGTTAKGALSLIQNTDAKYVLVDPSQKSFFDEIHTVKGNSEYDLLEWCDEDPKVFSNEQVKEESTLFVPEIQSDDLLLIFHSSGSSGNPKPIKHLHRFWTYSLCSAFGIDNSAFTTTPLFHGGLSDLLRCFQASSSLYFFGWHEQKAPSSENILLSIQSCFTVIKYFLSVPFILQMLIKEQKAISILQTMDLISTGGAPLPQQVGDEMVKRYNIKLVSRLGSSECGFLMSSWRHSFEKDKDWSWLRIEDEKSKEWLHFEKQTEEELYELIVTNDWPSKLVANRPNGDYATGDLYKPHPDHPDRWTFVRRADDGIVMVNGKKVGSTSIEESFKAHKQIHDVIVFGANRPFLGAILELKGENDVDKIRKTDLYQILKDVNQNVPSHAKMSQEMVYMVNQTDPLFANLPKTSKGTLQRGLALEQLSELINLIYTSFEQGKAPTGIPKTVLKGDHLLRWLYDIVTNISGKSIDVEEDLYSAGIDSIMAVRIRAAIHQYLDLGQLRLGSNVIYDYPTLRSLAVHIENQDDNSTQVDAKSLIEKYGRFDDIQWSKNMIPTNSSATVLLTGITGTLGSRIFCELIQDNAVKHILCHVRANDEEQAKSRILSSLKERKLNVGDIELVFKEKVSIILNLTDPIPQLIQAEKALIIHCGWIVNFALNVKSFESSCIAPLQRLLNLFGQCKNPFKFIFCSSLATILASDNKRHKEEISTNFEDSGWTGYGQSKWIAEQICLHLSKSISQQNSNANITIARIGQLCGDSQNGVWNETEAWPLLVRTANEVGCLPIEGPSIDWLKVDDAAKILVDLSLTEVQQHPLNVVHVALPSEQQRPSWKDFIDWLSSSQLAKFDQVPNKIWVDKVRDAGGKVRGNSLLSIWQNLSKQDQEDIIETNQCEKLSSFIGSAKAVDQKLTHKFVQEWISTSFCTSP